MRQVLLFLSFTTLSFALIPLDVVDLPEEGSSSAPMSRLRKKGGRGDGTCTDEALRKIMNE
ncbi:hypothetical protein GCK32_013163, partial [Trichostrongylus colubriformis]